MNSLVVLIGLILYNLGFNTKIFPNIFVAGINLGGTSPREGAQILQNSVKTPQEINLFFEKGNYKLDLKQFNFSYNFTASAQNAFNYTRTGNIAYDMEKRVILIFKPQNLGLSTNLDGKKMDTTITVISDKITKNPIYPSAKVFNKEIIIQKGEKGSKIDTKLLKAKIGQALAFNQNLNVEIPLKEIDPTLNDQQVNEFKSRAEKYIGKSINLNLDENTLTYDENDLLSLLNPKGGYDQQKIDNIVSTVASKYNSPPQNSRFVINAGKVKEFAPAKDGILVDQEELKKEILNSLDGLSQKQTTKVNIQIPVVRTPPKLTTGQVNNLGIQTLIGKGVSHFRGSISSRIYNVTLAASRLNGILIAPGETFSFNDALGDVSELTGYKQAYVIKEGRTVLGDGGGVCQVSTTFFRAALDAGLPIIERHAHSYRVGYYEQGFPPGIDATVYAPSVDLKVKNDTPGHILIQTKVDKNTYTLTFELYGTDDGRIASTTKPIVSNVTPPPEDLYVDDPTLPTGQIKQIDWKAWGASVKFSYTVTKNHEVVYRKTFYSNYRPWQAVYLRGI